MKNSTKNTVELPNFKGKQVNIIYASSFPDFESEKIKVEVEYEGLSEYFYSYTTDLKGFDRAQELEGKEKYKALYNLICNDIDQDILEWLVINF